MREIRPALLCVVSLVLLGFVGFAGPLPAQLPGGEAAEDSSYPSRCGTGIPEGERSGFTPLPRGDVFCPLIADPKGLRSFLSYLRGNEEAFATHVGSVGLADVFGIMRSGAVRPGDGIQLGLAGGVFAQFDLDSESYDLINADYLIGLALTGRWGAFSTRARFYHQSSHLGDEFLLRAERPDREDLAFESFELILSQDMGPLRVYGGGEYFVNRKPLSLPQSLFHGGAELRPGPGLRFGTLGIARLIAAADVKSVEEGGDWSTGVSARGGIEVGRPREGPSPGRRWSLLFEFYDGPSPYGQFFQSDVRLVGIGMHFTH